MENREYTLEEQKAHRKEWIDALRSGKYKQGKYALKNKNDEYCCLGVACEVAGIEASEYLDEDKIYRFDDMIEALNPATIKYFGLRDALGSSDLQYNLTTLNDDYDYDFNMIADIIESEPKGLFVE